jgi:hypothetical protein
MEVKKASPRNIRTYVVLVVSLLGVTATLSSSASEPPGSINGKIAIQVVPHDAMTTDLRDCEVHLVRTDDQTREITFECGSWFQPPIGRYLFWVEHGSRISFQSVITYAGEPFTKSGLMLVKTTFPAGTVMLDEKVAMPDDATFRLVSLERVEHHRAFDRRIARVHARKFVRVPVGLVLAGIFDRDGRVLSLSRAQTIASASTTTVNPEEPRHGKAHVVAVLERSSAKPSTVRCAAVLIAGSGLEPDVSLQTDDRMVLAWYDVAAPSTAELTVHCGANRPLTETVRLDSRTIRTIRAPLPAP